MKLSLMLVFFFSSISANSQERISVIESNVTNQRHVVQSYQDKDYLLSFDRCDSLSVFQIRDDFTKKLIRKDYFKGVYNNDDYFVDRNFYVSSIPDSFFVYNFVSGEIDYHAFPYQNYFGRCLKYFDNQCLYYLNDENFDNWTSGILDYKEGFVADSFPISTSALFYNYKFRAVKLETGSYALYEYDDKGELIDTIISNYTVAQTITVYDSIIYFLNNGAELYTYDLKSKETHFLFDLGITLLRANNVIVRDSLAYLFGTRYGEVRFTCLDLNKKEIIADYRQASGNEFMIGHSYVIDRKMISSNGREIIILDTKTNVVKVFDSGIGKYPILEVIDNEMLLNIEADEGHEFEISLYDIKNEVKHYTGCYLYDHDSGFSHISTNDKILILGSNDSRKNGRSIALIDKDNYTCLDYDSIDDSNSGLSSESELFMLGDNLLFIDESKIYKVVENEIFKLPINRLEKIDSDEYKIFDEKMYYIQSDPWEIRSYDGERFSVEMKLEEFISYTGTSSISDYYISSDKIFLKSSRDIFLYDQVTESLKEIEGNGFSTSDYREVFFNDLLFYQKDTIIYRIDLDGSINVAAEVTDTFEFGFIAEGIVVFNDKLLFNNNGKLNYINTNNEVIETECNFAPTNPFNRYEIINDHFIYRNQEGVSIFKDAECLTYPLDASYSVYHNSKEGHDRAFLFSYFTDEELNTVIYDFATAKFIEQDSSTLRRFNNLYFLESDTLFFEQEGKFPNLQGSISLLKNKFSETEVFKSSELIDVYGYDLIKNEDVTLICLGNKLYQYENEIFKLLNVFGVGAQTQFINHEGNSYFFAEDKFLGKQLYVFENKTSSVSNVVENSSEMLLYPNPTEAVLFVSIDEDLIVNNVQVNITDASGLLNIKKEVSSGEINVADLLPGFYVISFYKNNKYYVSKFIKN